MKTISPSLSKVAGLHPSPSPKKYQDWSWFTRSIFELSHEKKIAHLYILNSSMHSYVRKQLLVSSSSSGEKQT